MQYYCLYQTKPSALGQHLLATRTHCPFSAHAHTQIDDRALIDGSLQNQTDMLLGIKTPLRPFQRFFGGIFFFLLLIFYRAKAHAHNLTLSKTRSTSMLLPSNKQQREKESRVAHEYFATKMSQRAPQKSASCNFNYTRAWPHI